ncbi:hypothetical protein [Pedobacter aquatilis]|uniref:hypothetical protein n=1 Tax=Pedobacter aquatilis TaxID=351343 RepID=UPI00292E67A1|nr:hypothetical protein [Pedobacter aquatilis]
MKKHKRSAHAKIRTAIRKSMALKAANAGKNPVAAQSETAHLDDKMDAFMFFLDFLFEPGYSQEFREINPDAFFAQYAAFLRIIRDSG